MPRKKKEVPPKEQPLNYIQENDTGEGEFDPNQPLQITYALFGKKRDTIECGGALTAVIKPDSKGRMAVLSSVMGKPSPEVLVRMLTALAEHVREVVLKLEKEQDPASHDFPDVNTEEVEKRLALSQASFSKTFN